MGQTATRRTRHGSRRDENCVRSLALNLFPERRHAAAVRLSKPSRGGSSQIRRVRAPGISLTLRERLPASSNIHRTDDPQRGDAERRGVMAGGWFTGSVRLSKPTYRSHLNPAVQEARATTRSARSLAARWNPGITAAGVAESEAQERSRTLSVSVEARERERETEKNRDAERRAERTNRAGLP